MQGSEYIVYPSRALVKISKVPTTVAIGCYKGLNVYDQQGARVPFTFDSVPNKVQVLIPCGNSTIDGRVISSDNRGTIIEDDLGIRHVIPKQYIIKGPNINRSLSKVKILVDTAEAGDLTLEYLTESIKWKNDLSLVVNEELSGRLYMQAEISSSSGLTVEGDFKLVKDGSQNEDLNCEESSCLSYKSMSTSEESSDNSVSYHVGQLSFRERITVPLANYSMTFTKCNCIIINRLNETGFASVYLKTESPCYLNKSRLNVHYGDYLSIKDIAGYHKGQEMKIKVGDSPTVRYTVDKKTLPDQVGNAINKTYVVKVTNNSDQPQPLNFFYINRGRKDIIQTIPCYICDGSSGRHTVMGAPMVTVDANFVLEYTFTVIYRPKKR